MKSLAEFEYDIDNCSLWFSLVLDRAPERAPPNLVANNCLDDPKQCCTSCLFLRP
jgi:hypothetical protein